VSFSFLSTGVKTPVLKEVGAFLISRILLKVLVRKEEYSMLKKLKLTNMTDLQFGFTEGLNPIMASLLISEAKCEKIKNSKGINVGIMDVQSAVMPR
jgi:hypothetical protein